MSQISFFMQKNVTRSSGTIFMKYNKINLIKAIDNGKHLVGACFLVGITLLLLLHFLKNSNKKALYFYIRYGQRL